MTHWWTDTHGYIELEMTVDQMNMVPASGDGEPGVLALLAEPSIKEQVDKLNPETVRKVLHGYGTWDAEQLADHEANIMRLLWLASLGLQEELLMESEHG
jgi:hypothetical protein